MADELGIQIKLQQTKVIKSMATHIISLLQLVDEGWKMGTTSVNEKKVIQVSKNGQ